MARTLIRPLRDDLLVHMFAFSAFAASFMPIAQSVAENLEDALSAETVLGEEILAFFTGDDEAAAGALDAISNTNANVERVRTLFSANTMEVVVLHGQDQEVLDRVGAALNDAGQGVQALRKAVEANAIFYNALDAHNIDPERVAAVAISDDRDVTVYVLGRPQ